MTEHKAKRAIQKIARREGKSVAEIRAEMQAALDASRQNPDPRVQSQWREIPCKGAVPTVEEFIIHMAKKVKGPRP